MDDSQIIERTIEVLWFAVDLLTWPIIHHHIWMEIHMKSNCEFDVHDMFTTPNWWSKRQSGQFNGQLSWRSQKKSVRLYFTMKLRQKQTFYWKSRYLFIKIFAKEQKLSEKYGIKCNPQVNHVEKKADQATTCFFPFLLSNKMLSLWMRCAHPFACCSEISSLFSRMCACIEFVYCVKICNTFVVARSFIRLFVYSNLSPHANAARRVFFCIKLTNKTNFTIKRFIKSALETKTHTLWMRRRRFRRWTRRCRRRRRTLYWAIPANGRQKHSNESVMKKQIMCIARCTNIKGTRFNWYN